MEHKSTYTLIARALKQFGVEVMFGVVGIPVAPLALEAQAQGIRFIAMRNEQVWRPLHCFF